MWTVPIFAGRTTLRRAEADCESGVRHLHPPVYHGDPVDTGRSLVVHEWGDYLVTLFHAVSGLTTTRHKEPSWWHGIRGEMLDVLVSRKAL